jgi:3-oxoacyl-[acyl-carrier protein] reductase
MNLNKKTVVVTGGGRGIGRSLSLLFATQGAQVAVLDTNETDLAETVRQCAPSLARAYCCNVASEDEVVATFTDIERDLGGVDILINNAGITRDGLLVKVRDGAVNGSLSLAHWQQVIDVNLTGVFLCGREAATRMVAAGQGGIIINISSISRAGNAGQTNYSAAKAGVAAMAVVWAKELARYGIRSAAIAPGFVQTDILKDMKPEVLERTLAMVPAKRAGTVGEIAQAALYIVTNDYFTGRVLEVDGGLRI